MQVDEMASVLNPNQNFFQNKTESEEEKKQPVNAVPQNNLFTNRLSAILPPSFNNNAGQPNLQMFKNHKQRQSLIGTHQTRQSLIPRQGPQKLEIQQKLPDPVEPKSPTLASRLELCTHKVLIEQIVAPKANIDQANLIQQLLNTKDPETNRLLDMSCTLVNSVHQNALHLAELGVFNESEDAERKEKEYKEAKARLERMDLIEAKERQQLQEESNQKMRDLAK